MTALLNSNKEGRRILFHVKIQVPLKLLTKPMTSFEGKLYSLRFKSPFVQPICSLFISSLSCSGEITKDGVRRRNLVAAIDRKNIDAEFIAELK